MIKVENKALERGKSCYNTDRFIDKECSYNKIVFTITRALRYDDICETAIVIYQ